MDSVLEKITLYDLLGYLFPGSILMLIFLFGANVNWTSKCLAHWKDNTGILYFAFFLVSYLAGIALSEITEWVLCLLKKVVSRVTMVEKTADVELSLSQLITALKKSGVKDDDIERKSLSDVLKVYMQYMYGTIQSNSDYKRIHNYASAYVLYKNMAAAFTVGMIILVCANGVNESICLGFTFMILLLIVRSYRFYRKKEKYAVIWFMSMFSEKP